MSYDIWILLGAVLLDLVIAEPPAAVHLTVWIGRAISVVEKIGLGIKNHTLQFVFGMFASLILIAFFGGITYWLLSLLKGLNIVLYLLIGVIILKPTFCLKFNGQMSLLVEKYLKGSDLQIENADKKIRYLLTTVERGSLDETVPPIVSSTVRSLAENASDFLVAPLFYFLILGVPGAVAYRVANTLDGMLGHRGQYEYLGKFAAIFDDVVNFIPARLTAFFFITAAWLTGLNSKKAWHITMRDHAKTESPNGGWPMAAAAGALEVRLDRNAHYALGDADLPLAPGVIGHAVHLFWFMAATDIALSASVLWLAFYVF
ncbi:adenosylcobinamide-phosphate synthase [Dehalogenimonas formicexedens]|uniref:Cobalamin biosynthesis protein CobD n=2 Tax=Dehalogenimonas TaxID=670486 RepID=A0A1P8FA34_9CHLR|nr:MULTISPECIES: adenosylcobinamide-phosphate synthase CbiB [Dehalogenimonas]APV45298.1 adenosylcobinamide-phosphate synthase [Dehalogenimonas formicexedens]KTB49103.1 adenosylcobinamide-phosphate synthase [Dehalogenimonas alkenigignens]